MNALEINNGTNILCKAYLSIVNICLILCHIYRVQGSTEKAKGNSVWYSLEQIKNARACIKEDRDCDSMISINKYMLMEKGGEED